MTIHPLVLQLRFCRSEFQRSLQGVTPEEALKRFMPMNCISWTITHMASQEQRYWLMRGKGITLLPEVNKLAASGKPASTPPLDFAWESWHAITAATDDWLDTLTTESLKTFMDDSRRTGRLDSESIGSKLRRVAYHYYYHIGETQAIRQLLGHQNLPQFVGDIHEEAPYIAE